MWDILVQFTIDAAQYVHVELVVVPIDPLKDLVIVEKTISAPTLTLQDVKDVLSILNGKK